MKLQFKHQKFQADAAKAVVDVFAGQPYLTPTYLMDRGSDAHQLTLEEMSFTGAMSPSSRNSAIRWYWST